MAETRRAENVDINTKWSGNAKYPKQTYTGEPIAKVKNQVLLTRVPTTSLGSIGKTLIERLVGELLFYGAIPTDDMMLAMGCNPFMVTVGMKELMDVLNPCLVTYGAYQPLLDKTPYNSDFRQQSMDRLMIEEIREVCSEILPTDTSQPIAAGRGVEGLSRLELMRMQTRTATGTEGREEVTDPVKKQVMAFFSQSFDPTRHLPMDKRDAAGTNDDEWVKNFEFIAANFDVFNWWEVYGKKLYPLIYPVAVRILALPDSNGAQERTFSAATWMDGKLNTRQSNMTFQMKVLLYKNQGLLPYATKHAEEQKSEEARRKTKALLEKSRAYKKSISEAKASEETTGDGEDSTKLVEDDDDEFVDDDDEDEGERLLDILEEEDETSEA